MPNFKYGEEELYTGEQIVNSLKSCIDKHLLENQEVTFELGFELDNSNFTLKECNILTHKDLKDLEEKLNYYIVKYEYYDYPKSFLPTIATEQKFSIDYKKSLTFTISSDGERHFCNGFLIPNNYSVSSLLVFDAEGSQIPVYESGVKYLSGFQFCYCDLIPGETYRFQNDEKFLALEGASYVTMKGDEW